MASFNWANLMRVWNDATGPELSDRGLLTETENEARVPVLGDLPGVGNLFKSKQRTASKQEMLVFITPKMIADRAAAR